MGPQSGERDTRPNMRRTRIASALLAAILVSSTTAPGGAASVTSVVAGRNEGETVLLNSNPVLAEIAVVSPLQLRQILDGLAEVLANPSKTRGGLDQLDEETILLLEQNPALLEAWRSSPEASADLLALIRIAAGGGKPKR